MNKSPRKIRIIPVSESSEVKWLIGQVKEKLASVITQLDAVGESYDHDVPWRDRYVPDARNYLKRVKIGAIGRINTCDDAITLGVAAKCPAETSHFTSIGLYNVFKVARQMRKEVVAIKALEMWLTTYNNDKNSPHLFVNYSRDSYYG